MNRIFVISFLVLYAAVLADPGRVSAEPQNRTQWGALAIDSNQGPAYGWAINYPTRQDAERRALAECGRGCRVVMTFNDECAAYAADLGQGSTIHGWARGASSSSQAQSRARAACQGRGGSSCIVRAWGCTRR